MKRLIFGMYAAFLLLLVGCEANNDAPRTASSGADNADIASTNPTISENKPAFQADSQPQNISQAQQPEITTKPEGCHFKQENGIICSTPEAAAYAYQHFGMDGQTTGQSYNLALLQQAGCGQINYQKWLQKKLYEQSELNQNIPTPNGWIPVKAITTYAYDPTANGGIAPWYAANDYLEGECTPYHKKTSTPNTHTSIAVGAIYHVNDTGTIGCVDKRVTAEISWLSETKHLGLGRFNELSQAGQCTSFAPDEKLKAVRSETFSVPIGNQYVVIMHPLDPNSMSGPKDIYFMQGSVEKFK